MRRTVAVAMVALLTSTALTGCVDRFLDQGPAGSGDWAREFLSSDEYTELVFEVDYVSGQRPSSQAMDLLKQRARQHLSKPDGIQIRVDDSIDASESKWTTQEIRDLEDQRRDRTKEGSTAVMYVLYLDGEYSGGSGTVGLAYSASSFAIFLERIKDATGGVLGASTSDVEKAVVVHEMGHNIGLVDNGIPMCNPHEDPDHPKHSDNDDSVMFWAVETDPVQNFFGGRFSGAPPTTFDSDDECDMESAGGE